jgi:hypothetical protein
MKITAFIHVRIRHTPNAMQVPQCLYATGAAFVAIVCCGASPDVSAVDAALSAYRARGVMLLLDEEDDWLAARSRALLAAAAAAAAEMLPPLSCILWGPAAATSTGPDSGTSTELTAGAGGSAAAAQLTGSGESAADASLPVETNDRGLGMQGVPAGSGLHDPGLSLQAAMTAVRAAVEGALGSVPANDAPLTATGLTSAGAVQLVDALGALTGFTLPGALCDAATQAHDDGLTA